MDKNKKVKIEINADFDAEKMEVTTKGCRLDAVNAMTQALAAMTAMAVPKEYVRRLRKIICLQLLETSVENLGIEYSVENLTQLEQALLALRDEE